MGNREEVPIPHYPLPITYYPLSSIPIINRTGQAHREQVDFQDAIP